METTLLSNDGATESLDRKKGEEGKGNLKKNYHLWKDFRFSFFCQEVNKTP